MAPTPANLVGILANLAHISDQILCRLSSKDLSSLGEAHPPLKDVILTHLCRPNSDIGSVQFQHLLEVGRHSQPQPIKGTSHPEEEELLKEAMEQRPVGSETTIWETLDGPGFVECRTVTSSSRHSEKVTYYEVFFDKDCVSFHKEEQGPPLVSVPLDKPCSFPMDIEITVCHGLFHVRLPENGVGFLTSPLHQQVWDIPLAPGATLWSEGPHGKYVALLSYDECGPKLHVLSRETLDLRSVALPEPKMKRVECVTFREDLLLLQGQVGSVERCISLNLGQARPEDGVSVVLELPEGQVSRGLQGGFCFESYGSSFVNCFGELDSGLVYYTFPKLEKDWTILEGFLFPRDPEEKGTLISA